MQLIDFALLGLAVAAPAAQQGTEATTCPGLNGAQVFSCSQQEYKLECSKWVDVDPKKILTRVMTDTGYHGCLEACDKTSKCSIAEYVATDFAQTKGSCTLYKKGVPVKQGSSTSWTLATKIKKKKTDKHTKGGIAVPGKNDKFGLMVIKSGTPIHNNGVKAAHGRLNVGGEQDASCDKPLASDQATIYLKDGEAFLYAQSATPQQLWVGGEGETGYTTGAQPLPRNAKRKSFSVTKDGYLKFNGASPTACPPRKNDKDAGYSLWFSHSPASGLKRGCFSIELLAVKADEPVGCFYTSS